MTGLFSRIRTDFAPLCKEETAAESPATPLPTMMTSHFFLAKHSPGAIKADAVPIIICLLLIMIFLIGHDKIGF